MNDGSAAAAAGDQPAGAEEGQGGGGGDDGEGVGVGGALPAVDDEVVRAGGEVGDGQVLVVAGGERRLEAGAAEGVLDDPEVEVAVGVGEEQVGGEVAA